MRFLQPDIVIKGTVSFLFKLVMFTENTFTSVTKLITDFQASMWSQLRDKLQDKNTNFY